jgi:hypothetical protein
VQTELVDQKHINNTTKGSFYRLMAVLKCNLELFLNYVHNNLSFDKRSEVKCSEGLSNWVSNITTRHIDHMRLSAYMAYSFVTSFYIILVSFFIILCVITVMYFYCYVICSFVSLSILIVM